MKPELTPRLMAVAEKAGECDILCDIGCDHGYLPIYLVKNSLVKEAYACDVREGPLTAAKKNIRINGFEDKITTVLSDGLKEVSDKSFDCITICGMGGILISEILSASEICAKKAKKIILQPMTEVDYLRKYLFDNGFTIYDEEIARENERYYSIICVKTGEEKEYDAFDLKFGKKIFSKKSSDIKKYLEKNYNALKKNLEAKRNAGRENTDELDGIVGKLEKIIKIH